MPLSHLRAGLPAMVDVAGKAAGRRTARAEARIRLPEQVWTLFGEGAAMRSPKGQVIATAVLAGTMAVKKTSDLIPLCHNIPIHGCSFESERHDDVLAIQCEVTTENKTGVEMEALTGVSVAALTVYDMCKSVSHGISIEHVCLLSKHGGKTNQ